MVRRSLVPVVFLTVLVPGAGLVGLAVHSIQEERELLERAQSARRAELARLVSEGVRAEVLADLQALDGKLREALAEGDDLARLREEEPDALVLDGERQLLVPQVAWGAEGVAPAPDPNLAPVLRLEATDPEATLAALEALKPSVRRSAAARNLRARLLVRLGRDEEALKLDAALLADADSPARLRRVAALRRIEVLSRLGRGAEGAEAAGLALQAQLEGGGKGETAASHWFALARLTRLVGSGELARRAADPLRLARLAADLESWEGIEAAPGAEALDARYAVAAHGDGWIGFGPPRGSADLRVARVLPRAELERRVQAAFDARAGADRQAFAVTLADATAEAAPLGSGVSFTVTPLETAAGSALARQRAQQRLAVLGGLVLIVVVGSLLVARSMRKRAELARLRADFVASVTHELRTPVASIRAMAEVLSLGKIDDPERRASYFQAMCDESRRLGRLIDDVLDVARIERGAFVPDLEPGSVVAVAREVCEELRSAAQTEGHALECELPDDLPPVLVDRMLLGRALSNLVVNAIKYAGGDGPITVSARAHEGRVEVAVTDRGAGIPAHEHGRVFERFVRGSGAEGKTGAGLGLAIVESIVRGHGGSVGLESQPGAGSTFTLRLPIWEDPSGE